MAVLVLGAGLAGLSTALHLAERGVPARVVEREGRVGGHAVTIDDDGFRFDRTGHLLHLRDPALRALVERLLPGRLRVIQRQSRVWSHGGYTRYPYQANTFGLPPAVANECLIGYLRAREQPPATPPATFEDFCRAHFGAGFAEHFMIPYNERLWGVPLAELTADWCARFVPLPKLEDVIAGAVGLHDRELGYNASFVYPETGIGELPEAMARGLDVRLNAPVERLDWRRRELTVAGENQPYEHLVSTLPLDLLGAALVDPPAEVRAAIAALRCTSLTYLDVAVDAPCPLPYHWVYVPERRYPFYRVGCYSSFSPALAPPGCSSLYVELVDRAEDVADDAIARVVAHLVEMRLIADARAVRFVRVRRVGHAYVVHDRHHEPARRVILEFLEQQRIRSIGRYGGWNYSSMEDALAFGRDAADEVIAWGR